MNQIISVFLNLIQKSHKKGKNGYFCNNGFSFCLALPATRVISRVAAKMFSYFATFKFAFR